MDKANPVLDTILFDLDGTLLQFSQDEFMNAYLAKLRGVFSRLGMDADKSIDAVWAGTKAMMLNDGAGLNSLRFWVKFAEKLDLSDVQCKAVEAACDDFYRNDFDSVKSILGLNDISKKLVHALSAKGYGVVLATNPLFPECAVETRLKWIGLAPGDFLLVTHYANSTFCKPNHGYFREVLSKIGKSPENCFMAGNNPVEDMSAGGFGIETYLVTDCLDNEYGVDISGFRQGTLAELAELLTSLPDL